MTSTVTRSHNTKEKEINSGYTPHNTYTSTKKAIFLTMHMPDGPAGQWAAALEAKAQTQTPTSYGTWTDIIADFKRAFISDDMEKDARGALFSLKQTTDVTSYNNRFRTLAQQAKVTQLDRKSTRLNSSHSGESRMPSSA